MRRCKECKKTIPTAAKSETMHEKKGFCSIDCMADYGLAKARQQIQKKDRAETKARKEQLKTKADYAKEAQTEFNRWVRLRDKDEPCISCGRHHQGQYHAGHYRSVGSHPELRFEPLNCHKQCMPCNSHKSGNVVEYRINLARKIGAEKLEWLEGNHEPKRYTIEELKQIKAHYKKLANELQKHNIQNQSIDL